MNRTPEEILIRPVITEKTSALQFDGTDAPPPGADEDMDREVKSKYTFEVVRDAGKIEVRQAVEELFDVKVTNVRTMNMRGKKRRVERAIGRRPGWKKAIVTVAEGETIDVYEGL